ncbi:MAG: alpha/beta hydrolase, partial [Alicyclobacillus sp. RIFOXYA1_FULL_53_8]
QFQGLTLRGMEHVPANAAEPLPAAIFYHGFTSTKLEPHRFFLKACRALEELGIASFRFDFLGSGESDGNFEDMTLHTELNEAAAILDMVKQDPRIDAERVFLVGLSMGGLVASLLAGDRPDDVHGLVLLAPAGNMPEVILNAIAEQEVSEGQEVFDYDGDLVGKGFVHSLQNLAVYERAAGYLGPVLLVHGTKDEAVPYHVSHHYHERAYAERAVLRIVEDADHTFNSTPWERKVIASIRDFVTTRLTTAQ